MPGIHLLYSNFSIRFARSGNVFGDRGLVLGLVEFVNATRPKGHYGTTGDHRCNKPFIAILYHPCSVGGSQTRRTPASEFGGRQGA